MNEPKEDGDFVIVLSSDLIAKVMNKYFNQDMFIMSVKVVDLQATESGYAFTLRFVSELDDEDDEQYSPGSTLMRLLKEQIRKRQAGEVLEVDNKNKRDKKGRFVKNELPN